jgi:DNA-binding NtrC family response regulator
MTLFQPQEAKFVQAVSRIVYVNPFVPQRIEAEREALGDAFVPTPAVWSALDHIGGERANVLLLAKRGEALAQTVRARLADDSDGARGASARQLTWYEDLVLYLLFYRYVPQINRLIENPPARGERVAFYEPFCRDVEHYLRIPGVRMPSGDEPPHLIACFFQIRRAFQQIFDNIIGTSPAIARLRAAVWESIFTHDLGRYRRSLYARMGDHATLVTGPSGTGKELVARAIGLSRYIPFDARRRVFSEDFEGSFYPLNLAALSPTLIESELFGHRRGSFTGAVEDHVGWLEVCRPLGAVFLDEIGELDGHIQVKLLRVLQTRTFQRLGESESRRFEGKIIAATNRDPAAEMRAGRFRADLYYRLCADIITTPSLRQILDEAPDELPKLVGYIARRVAGDRAEGDAVAEDATSWVRDHLPRDYPWPGNFRELEQCVRNVMVRRSYHPATIVDDTPRSDVDQLVEGVRAGAWTADELVARYAAILYRQCGSYEAAARKLGLDRRTVKAKVNADPHRAGQGATG